MKKTFLSKTMTVLLAISLLASMLIPQIPVLATDGDDVAAAKAALTWDTIKGNNLSQNWITSDTTAQQTTAKLNLVTSLPGFTGSVIWSSNEPNVINAATGVVTRPAANGTYDQPRRSKYVDLTAIIYKNGITDTKTFSVYVPELPTNSYSCFDQTNVLTPSVKKDFALATNGATIEAATAAAPSPGSAASTVLAGGKNYLTGAYYSPEYNADASVTKFITINLGQQRTVYDFVLLQTNQTNNMFDSMLIQGSNDNATWTDLVNVAKNYQMITARYTLDTPVTYQYFKFTYKKVNVVNQNVKLYAIKIIGNDGTQKSTAKDFPFTGFVSGPSNTPVSTTITTVGSYITVKVPVGTDFSLLKAKFTFPLPTGTTLYSWRHTTDVAGVQVTATNFAPANGGWTNSAQVTNNERFFHVVAPDGSIRLYTVKVFASDGSSSCDITNLSVAGATGVIESNNIINVTVPSGTDVTSLTPSITASAGATVSPSTAQNFTNSASTPIKYTVTAADGVITKTYYVNVKVNYVASSACDITAFGFSNPAVTATISGTNITATVPYGTSLTNLVASFTNSANSTVKVGTTTQVSGTTANNFSAPVTYTVTAEDGTTTKNYTVTISVAPITPITSVTINKDATSIVKGSTEQLSATTAPSDASLPIAVTWSSSNTSVATVNSSTGLVTAVDGGTATITATATNSDGVNTYTVTDTCEVTVTINPSGVTLNKPSTTINIGSTETLTATVDPSNATDKSVTWSSSNNSIATVNNNGVVTPVAVGTATVTVTTTVGGKTATCAVTVLSEAIVNVNSLINALPSPATMANKNTILAARSAYDALTATEKSFISYSVYTKLAEAEYVIFKAISVTDKIANPSFESGTASWNTFGTTSAITDPANIMDGSKAFQMNSGSGAYQFINLLPYTSYTISAWVKAEVSGEPVMLKIFDYDTKGSGSNISTTSTNTVYTKVSISFVTGSDPSAVNVTLYKQSGAKAWVDNVELYQINRSIVFDNYNINGQYLTNVTPGKTDSDFLAGLTVVSGTAVLKNSDNSPFVSGNHVGTGTKLVVTDGSQVMTYTVIIYGDVTGDGDITLDDLAAIKLHLLKSYSFSPGSAQFKAGDIFKKGSITISDLIAVKKKLIGLAEISQN